MDKLLNHANVRNYHLGHLFLDSLETNPDDIYRIDAATGQEESRGSIKSRSIRLAQCLRRFGLHVGDIVSLSGFSHLDIHVPFYASLLNGLTLAALDPLYLYDEIKTALKISKPRVVFCEETSYNVYAEVVRDLGLDTKIITFGNGDKSLTTFMEEYASDEPEQEFKPSDFDPKTVYAWLMSTSGTTGQPKLAAFTHDTFLEKYATFYKMFISDETFKRLGHKKVLHISSVQWVTSFISAVVEPLFQKCIIQTSEETTIPHIIEMINKHKPGSASMSPSVLSLILNSELPCDLTCFKMITIVGGKMQEELYEQLKHKMNVDSLLLRSYGMTELLGLVLMPNPAGPAGNIGKECMLVQCKLINPETKEDVMESFTHGELCLKGTLFSCYYGMPEATAEAFTADGWFKTGDIMYRDEDNYFYVERLKLIMKYMGTTITPSELEDVISTHPEVLEVGVTSVPALEGDRPVAFVVRTAKGTVTAQQIKDLVKGKLSKNKQLHGGVIFLKELPKTFTDKIAIRKLREMAKTMQSE